MIHSKYKDINDFFHLLGVHIGHLSYDGNHHHSINYVLTGVRDDFLVIDTKKTSFFLKRALVFLYNLNTNISFNFFGYSDFAELPMLSKLCFTSIVTSGTKRNVFMNLP